MHYAVVDIGTNSARLMIAHDEGGKVISLFKTLRMVRIGEGMVTHRKILPAAMKRTRDALFEFLKISERYGAADSFFCFATSAVRDADNRQEFIEYIQRECSIAIDIISGDMEARLGFAGSVEGYGGMFDIGGGSTEVMVGSLSDVWFEKSFRIGTVRCLQMFPGADDADPEAYRQAHALAADTFRDVPEADLDFTGIGGTATALAAIDLGMRTYDPARIQGHEISLSRAQEICDMLKRKNKQQRKTLIGLEEKKADVIVFGAIIMLEFMRTMRLARITVSDRDNQEGYLQKKLGLV